MPDAPKVRNLVLILTKDLGSRLATPVFVVDHEGTLLYFNEAAEPLLGLTYAETGKLRSDEWAKLFEPRDDQGNLLPVEEIALGIALLKHEPAHRPVTIQAADGVKRRLAVTALPLFAHADEFVGAVALFWSEE